MGQCLFVRRVLAVCIEKQTALIRGGKTWLDPLTQLMFGRPKYLGQSRVIYS